MNLKEMKRLKQISSFGAEGGKREQIRNCRFLDRRRREVRFLV